MLEIDRLAAMYASWRSRQYDRDVRMETIDRVVRGDFDVFDPDEESVDSRSPNLIQVALEDTAESASLVPTVRVQPERPNQQSKKTARTMEQVAVSYMDINKMDLLIPRSVMDKAAYGMSVWTISPDFDQEIPLIERRDPRQCYPEPGFRPGDEVHKCMFTREVFFSQLPSEYQDVLRSAVADHSEIDDPDENAKVVLVEYYDEDEYVLAGLYQASTSGLVRYKSGSDVPYPVLLERIENKIGICPVVIGSRISLDGEIRGQFDQVVGLLEAHIRLMGLILDYADQAVYSDIFVKDLIGEMPYGGGSFIELGPQGAIGRVPPAVSSLNVQQDLMQLIDGIHLGGRYPKSRPGEIDQSIASAKFLEASAGMMNTAIRTYHQILQRQMERALRIALEVDKAYFPKSKTASGILRNQEFLTEYNPKTDIDTKNLLRVEYGLGLGRDPAQSAVLHIQYSQAEFVSKEFVQENIDGLTDVGRERSRLDVEKFRGMALAKLLQGLEAGTIPNEALIEIARSREKGEDLFDIFEKYVVLPEQEAVNAQQQNMIETGLGPPMEVGAGPPPPEGMPAPPPPGGAELLARLGTPAGDGGMLGTQVTG
tara:strand:- start:10413 stop:12203 length:1791 start_codon:yes stop_codon:yes gene_type:complete